MWKKSSKLTKRSSLLRKRSDLTTNIFSGGIMSKKFLIAGNIVDTLADKWTPEDVTPIEIDEYIKGLSDS